MGVVCPWETTERDREEMKKKGEGREANSFTAVTVDGAESFPSEWAIKRLWQKLLAIPLGRCVQEQLLLHPFPPSPLLLFPRKHNEADDDDEASQLGNGAVVQDVDNKKCSCCDFNAGDEAQAEAGEQLTKCHSTSTATPALAASSLQGGTLLHGASNWTLPCPVVCRCRSRCLLPQPVELRRRRRLDSDSLIFFSILLLSSFFLPLSPLLLSLFYSSSSLLSLSAIFLALLQLHATELIKAQIFNGLARRASWAEVVHKKRGGVGGRGAAGGRAFKLKIEHVLVSKLGHCCRWLWRCKAACSAARDERVSCVREAHHN